MTEIHIVQDSHYRDYFTVLFGDSVVGCIDDRMSMVSYGPVHFHGYASFKALPSEIRQRILDATGNHIALLNITKRLLK
jgi:hypothetical protein